MSPTSTDSADFPGRDDDAPDPDTVLERIHARSKEIERRELDAAIRKLRARGDLSEDQRAIVEEMADRIVGELLAAPVAAVQEAEEDEEREAAATLVRLFDPHRDR